MVYNLLSVLFSGYIFYEAGMAGWWTGYNWLCQDIDRAADPDSKGKLLKFILRPLKFIPPTLFVSLWLFTFNLDGLKFVKKNLLNCKFFGSTGSPAFRTFNQSKCTGQPGNAPL